MTSDLRESLWHQSCREQITAPVLDGSVRADLVVIGGGYTGLSAALHAAETGAKVVLLDAGELGGGGSGRNVGLANAGLWLPPTEIMARLGAEAGLKLYKTLAQAPKTVYGLIERHQIDCEPVQKGTLHCAHAPSGMKDLQNRFDQLRGLGAPVQLLGAEEARQRVGSDQVHGALFDPRAGTIQPLAYAKGLARAAAEHGATLYEQSEVTAIAKDGDGWRVSTKGGTVTAGALIMATNAYATPIAGYEAPKIVPVHYFQAATAPLPEAVRAKILLGGEGCWDTALVMSSWRLDQAGRLIIGAMGELHHVASSIHENWLRRKIAALFPELKTVPFEHLWHGRIAMTGEYLPKILRTGANAYTVFGYSGRGIGPGTMFGKAVGLAVLSGDERELPVSAVDTHSLPMAGVKRVYYEFGAVVTHLGRDRL